MKALLTACASLALLLSTPGAQAQSWPTKPIKLVNGFAAGGGSDLLARFLADKLSGPLGQQVVVEPRTGAGGLVAGQAVAQSEPDGHTLLQVTMGMLSISPVMPGVRMTFDADRDIVPVIKTAGLYNVLIMDPKLPYTTVPALIAFAKANPGKLSYASSGNGSSQHLAGELFKAMTGIDMLHVPYRGAAPAVLDITGGAVCCMFTNLPDVIGQIQGGALKAVAYGTVPGASVVPAPTIAEQGVPGFQIDNWFGIGAPKGTPPAVIERLNAEINRIVTSADGKARLDSLGFLPYGGTPDDLRQSIAADRAKWGQLIKDRDIKAE